MAIAILSAPELAGLIQPEKLAPKVFYRHSEFQLLMEPTIRVKQPFMFLLCIRMTRRMPHWLGAM